MSLNEQIEKQLIIAMKEKDADKVSVLRMLKTSLTNVKIQKKRENLTDDEVLDIIRKQAKQRQESLESFAKAGRTDLAGKEKKELSILEGYLPKQLEDSEIRTLAQAVIQSLGVTSKSETGRVMKELMPQVKGKADGKRVSDVVGSLLS